MMPTLKDRPLLTDNELASIPAGSIFLFDIECYPNYFLIAFKHKNSGKYLTFELWQNETFDRDKLNWLLFNFLIVGFNSNDYDIVMAQMSLYRPNCNYLKQISNDIIQNQLKYWVSIKKYKLTKVNYNHIDLIEVAPLKGSLKLYGARLHCPTIQKLPYHHETELTWEQKDNVKNYCFNDLDVTDLLLDELRKPIELRYQLSDKYNVDTRSKSDAQIAEEVIKAELKHVGIFATKPKVDFNEPVSFTTPAFINFKTKQLQDILKLVESCEFYLGADGKLSLPKQLQNQHIKINKSEYKLAKGGLHSREKSELHRETDDLFISDFDMESFYPKIILNEKLFPKHLGEAFLEAYEKIVNERVSAKRSENKPVADSLKIVINGLFGKFGNSYSIVFSPKLLIQVTLTGQLFLLMLIELMETNGITVISANTDGIILKYNKNERDKVLNLIKHVEETVHFKTEETRYKTVASRDVNNYIAIKHNDEIKAKGCYAEVGSALNSKLSKNPQSVICSKAIWYLLAHDTPIEETINNCNDITQFVTVRNVKGGGYKDGQFLGKVVRWYYAKNEKSFICYANGNKVATSDGAKPLMSLPTLLPEDIDYARYINETNGILADIGYYKQPKIRKLF